MASSLKIIATPIGNAQDISLRAIKEIESADVILAEDTRHSKKLVQILGVKLKSECCWLSCPSQKESQRSDIVAERLEKNHRVILMSDAGCPAISDPGSLLVQAIVEKGFGVEVIPGPSAHCAAIMAAGINVTRFAFLGFLPQKKILRKSMTMAAANAGLALIFYESPKRVVELLHELQDYLGERRVVVARELTKAFETFHRGALGTPLSPPFVDKGECVVIVEAGELIEKISSIPCAESIDEFIADGLKQNLPPKELAQKMAIKFNMKKKKAYEILVKAKDVYNR